MISRRAGDGGSAVGVKIRVLNGLGWCGVCVTWQLIGTVAVEVNANYEYAYDLRILKQNALLGPYALYL